MSCTLPNEKELLWDTIRGDKSAYASIYRHYHPGIYCYILRFVKLPDLAEDLVHDVFMKIWEIRERIDPERCFSGYCYRIARNHVYKTLQQFAADHALRHRLVQQSGAAYADLKQASWQTGEYERLLALALSKLPGQRRNVFLLCREEGKTYQETAAILRISGSSVKKHMVLAMREIYDFVLRHGDLAVTQLDMFCRKHKIKNWDKQKNSSRYINTQITQWNT